MLLVVGVVYYVNGYVCKEDIIMEMPRFPEWLGTFMFFLMALGFFSLVGGIFYFVYWLLTNVTITIK